MDLDFFTFTFLTVVFLLLAGICFGRHKIHPPMIDFPIKGKGIVDVYTYFGTSRYRSDPYKRYRFLRDEKGKWRYAFDNKKTVIKIYAGCIAGLLLFDIFVCFIDGSMIFPSMVLSPVFAALFAVCLFGGEYLQALEPYIILMLHFRKRKADKEKGKDYRYINIERTIKLFSKFFVLLIWLGFLCFLWFPVVGAGIHLYAIANGKGFPIIAVFEMSVLVPLFYVWICLGKFLRGDHSCRVPLRIAGKWGKYDPQYLLDKLNGNRSNVILVKNKQGQVRIYGSVYKHVLEVRIGKAEKVKYFHLTQVDTDSIVPVSYATPVVIDNKWYEKFPAREQWLVGEQSIVAFLTKLYICKDLNEAMNDFSFCDTTEEIGRLMEDDAYIVPEIPVDWPAGGIQSNMGQAWLRRKDARLKMALKILQKG